MYARVSTYSGDMDSFVQHFGSVVVPWSNGTGSTTSTYSSTTTPAARWR
jgi:hypothetical protein